MCTSQLLRMEVSQTSFLYEMREHLKKIKLNEKQHNFIGRVQKYIGKHFGTITSTALSCLL